jgi:hypothetical protein
MATLAGLRRIRAAGTEVAVVAPTAPMFVAIGRFATATVADVFNDYLDIVEYVCSGHSLSTLNQPAASLLYHRIRFRSSPVDLVRPFRDSIPPKAEGGSPLTEPEGHSAAGSHRCCI